MKDKYINAWPCRVVDIDDDEKMGRIKVRIFHVHHNMPDDDLPWTHMISSLAGRVGKDGESFGTFMPPVVGGDGWVTFFMGDPLYPIYVGQLYGKPDGNSDVPDVFTAEDFPNIRGYVDPSGFKIIFNDTKKTMLVTDRHDNRFFIDASGEKGEGSLEIDATGDMFITVDQKLDVAVDGGDLALTLKENAIINVSKDFELKVKNMKVEADDKVDMESEKDFTISSKSGTIFIKAGHRDVEIEGADITLNAQRFLNLKSGIRTNFS